MIHAIKVGSGWCRYKTTTIIAPGDYYKLDGKPTDLLKRQLALQAVSDPNGRFHWITPAAEWIRFVLLGQFVKETTAYGRDIDIAHLTRTFGGFDITRLRPWQLRTIADAVSSLESGFQYRRGCIVSLGGGKTLAGLLLGTLGDRSAVLAPRHTHDTWRRDADKWQLPCPIISTYESAHRIEPVDVLILDEILLVCNPDTLRAEKARLLSKDASIVVGLTGTPTSARGPLDWRWLDCVRPGCVPTNEVPWRFLFSTQTEVKEVAPGRKAYVTPATSWDTERIASYVGSFLMRVDTSELLAHLPPATYTQLSVPKPKDWDVVMKGAATTHGASKRLTQARMLSDGFVLDDDGNVIRLDMNKINAVGEFVEGLGEPVVIFAAWRETISALVKRLHEYSPAIVSGDTADIGFQIQRFLNEETDVLIVNSRAGSGIDGLQQRSRIEIFVSNSTSPVDRVQAEGRIYRSGQNRGCQIVDVVAEDTLDVRQLELLKGHNDLSASMVEKILLEALV